MIVLLYTGLLGRLNCSLHLLTHLGELWYVLPEEVAGDEGPGEDAQAI